MLQCSVPDAVLGCVSGRTALSSISEFGQEGAMMASDRGTSAPTADGRTVVTRFAPSPTGYLHIGGARTALFNWLFARRHGGKYLLRIEDTDRARSAEPAIEAIFDGLRWLGLDGDEPATFQFARSGRHAEVAQALLDAGHAYRCYLTAEELAARRDRAQAERRPFRIDSEWRECDPATVSPDVPYVVRIKAPREGETAIDDLVQGRVTVSNAEIDDFVVLRSDGTPTYMLAAVVDDHDMGVTHIIRGDDHLNNAFRQLAIIRAMRWEEPIYAHVPLIHGSDGAKLSKRHGALGVDAYRDEMGILPEALFNYLLRLGWGHGDDEIISRDQAVEWFDISHVGKSPSRFDTAKLQNLNSHYIREAGDARLAGLTAARMRREVDLDLLTRAMPVLKVRAKDLDELSAGAAFLFAQRPLALDARAEALLTPETRALLGRIQDRLERENGWTSQGLEASLKSMAEEIGLGLGKLAQPLRAALTGLTTSPGIFDVLTLLGRQESLARIAAQATPAEGR
jgi:glutamyl-tRNA synthetase